MSDDPPSQTQDLIPVNPTLIAPGRPRRHDSFVTVALVLVNWGVWICMAHDASAAGEAYRWGSMSAYYAAAGQWWRPFTYMFLHWGWVHLAMNTLFIFLFGRTVERVLGHAGLLCLALTSGLFPTLAAWLKIEPMNNAVGSSGVVFGLCGAFVFFNFQIISRVSRKGRRNALRWLAVVLVAFGPNHFSALLAHLLGFMAGAGAMALAWRRGAWQPRARRWRLQLLLTASAALLALAPLAFYPNPTKLAEKCTSTITRKAYAEALPSLETMIRYFPDFDWPYSARISCLMFLDRREDALNAADRAVWRFPSNAVLRLQRGQIYQVKGNALLASLDFDEAQRLSPTEWQNYINEQGRPAPGKAPLSSVGK